MYQWYPSTSVDLFSHTSCCDPSPYSAISHESRLLLWEEVWSRNSSTLGREDHERSTEENMTGMGI